MKKVQILTPEAVKQKIIRIAYQIAEENYGEKEIVLIGVKPNGLTYAELLRAEIEKIDHYKVVVAGVRLNKDAPLDAEIVLEGAPQLDGKVVILADDVANTGKTLYYALKPIMAFSPKKVQTTVLVDRQHKMFPVTADFVGMSLSTTLKEHISVTFDKKGNGTAYLV